MNTMQKRLICFALSSLIWVCDVHSPPPCHHTSISQFLLSYYSTLSLALTIYHHRPQPNPSYHNDFPINFLFVKLNHHLLGFPSPPSYILANSLEASSWRTWARYCRSTSASWRSRGGSNIWLWERERVRNKRNRRRTDGKGTGVHEKEREGKSVPD